MEGKVVGLLKRNLVKRDFEQLPRYFAFIYCINKDDLLRSMVAHTESEQDFSYTGTNVHKIEIVRNMVVVGKIVDDGRTEAIIAKEAIPAAKDENPLPAVLREDVVVAIHKAWWERGAPAPTCFFFSSIMNQRDCRPDHRCGF